MIHLRDAYFYCSYSSLLLNLPSDPATSDRDHRAISMRIADLSWQGAKTPREGFPN